MPQLDINTFLFQYISLVIAFVFIYTLLSYIILPLILRAIVLREKLLLGSETKSYYLLYTSNIAFNKIQKLVDLDWAYLFVEKLNMKSFPLLWSLSSNNNSSFLEKEKLIIIPTTISYLTYINLVLILLEEEKVKKF